MAYNGSIYVVT